MNRSFCAIRQRERYQLGHVHLTAKGTWTKQPEAKVRFLIIIASIVDAGKCIAFADHLPKATHNDDAAQGYTRQEPFSKPCGKIDRNKDRNKPCLWRAWAAE